MKRREVLAWLAMASMDASAFAQAHVRRIGFLHPGQSTVLNDRIAAIREGLTRTVEVRLSISLSRRRRFSCARTR
jgi:hypothetical protein